MSGSTWGTMPGMKPLNTLGKGIVGVGSEPEMTLPAGGRLMSPTDMGHGSLSGIGGMPPAPGKPMPQRIGTMENMPGALPGRPMPTSTGGFQSGMMPASGGIGGSMPGARPMPTGQMPTAPQGSPMPRSPNVFMQPPAVGTSAGQPMTGQSPMVNPPAPLSTGPGFNDLRGNTIGMGNVSGPNFGQANGYMNQAAGNIGGIQTKNYGQIASQNAQPTLSALQSALQQSNSPMSNQLRQMGMTSLQGLSSAPDRAQLAAQALQLQRTMTEPQFQQDMRSVGQKAAAFGRTGAGMTTNELTDVALAREKNLNQFGEQAALDAAGQTMNDRLGIFNATAGYGNQIGNQDLAHAGFTSNNALDQFNVQGNVRNQNVDERNFQAQQGMNQASLAAQRAGLFGNLGNMASGNAMSSANFGMQNAMNQANLQMQQQGRQDSQAQQAIQNAYNQQLLQEQLLNGAFNRQQQAGQMGMQYGMGNDPYGMQMQGANAQQQNASSQQQALAQQAQYEQMQRYLASGGGGY